MPNDNATTMPRRSYTMESFCDAYDVGKTFTYGEIKAGRLRAVKAGYRTLIPVEAAQAWFASLPDLRTQKAA